MTTTTAGPDHPRLVDPPGPGPVLPPRRDARRPGTRRRRAVVVLVLGALVLACSAATGLWLAQRHLDGQVERVPDVFAGLADRPAPGPAVSGRRALNVLVVGTDRRAAELLPAATGTTEGPDGTDGTDGTGEWVPGSRRTELVAVLHVDADRRSATLVSIPGEALVPVAGAGPARLEAAFGGERPAPGVQAVEALTGLRIDHLAVVDWADLEVLVDAAGGVDVHVPRTIEDEEHHVVWVEGPQRLDGAQAVRYVRERPGLSDGDVDRVRRQQAVLRSVVRDSLRTLRGHDPWAGYQLLDRLSGAVAVDDGWTAAGLRRLLLDLRSVPLRDVHFLTAPVAGTDVVDERAVVRLDGPANASLWDAVRRDDVAAWLVDNADLAGAREVVGPAG